MVGVQRDEGEHAFGHLDFGRAQIAVGDDLDPHRHRRPADPLDLGIDRDQVAQVDRREEPIASIATVATGPCAREATMPAAMSIWLSTQPPKM